MSKEKSKTTDKSSVQLKDAASRRRVSIQMADNILLIWLDNKIDDSRVEYNNVLVHLSRVVHTVNKYTDTKQCIEFLATIDNENVYMIISGSLGQHVVPQLHNMSRVDSIFIFCGNKNYHEQWAKEWSKIKGVFTEIEPICEALKKAAQQCKQNSMSISILGTNDDVSRKNLDQLEPSFICTQVLKEILLSTKFEQQHTKEFIQYCLDVFANNKDQLGNVKEFERQYCEETSIWWYTCECFLYGMLNRGLQVMDMDIIIRMGFFIANLHRHIEQLYQKRFGGYKFGESFIVYRGQGISKVVFEQLSKTKGGLLSFNSFLSVSTKQDVSLTFAENATTNNETIGVLFQMTIDPTQPNTSFASIADVENLQEAQDEMLFSMGTVFRIGEISPMGENNRLFQVKLTLVKETDQDLRALTNRIREETFPEDKGWLRLGKILVKMGQFNKAQRIYKKLLELTTDELEKECIYDELGQIQYKKGDHQQAIKMFTKSLEIKNKILLPTDLSLAISHSHIGNVYYNMGDYPNALSFYEKALTIRQESLPSDHSDLASSYNNIGVVYDSMGDYPHALSSHTKALTIREKSLLSNHPHLAMSYNNIGVVYDSMGDYPNALSSHEKALAIREQSLSPNDPRVASSYDNIGLVYKSMDDDTKALSYHTKALAIRQQSLPSNHPHLAISYNNIGMVYDSMSDYEKALSSHEKAFEIREQSLPPNHPDIGSSYNNIGMVYEHMNKQSEARFFYERAVSNGECLLPPDHPILRQRRKNLEDVEKNWSNYCVLYEE